MEPVLSGSHTGAPSEAQAGKDLCSSPELGTFLLLPRMDEELTPIFPKYAKIPKPAKQTGGGFRPRCLLLALPIVFHW